MSIDLSKPVGYYEPMKITETYNPPGYLGCKGKLNEAKLAHTPSCVHGVLWIKYGACVNRGLYLSI